MPTEPSVLPRYASGASGDDIAEPPDAKKTSGWAIEFVPYQVLNWLHRYTYEWIVYLRDRGHGYDTLEELIADTADGELGVLNEVDVTSLPGSQLASISAGTPTVDVACDGTYVYIANAATVRRYTRTGGVAGTTYTPTNAGTIVRVATNGEHVVVAYDTYVECFLASTGASVWVYQHSVVVNDVAMDATRVYSVTAASGPLDVTARAILITDGSDVWEYKHDGATGAVALTSVATDGRSVFVAGGASGEASGANLRALNAATGADASDGGGPGGTLDTAGLAWDAVTATAVSGSGCLAVDDQRLYVGYQTAVTIEARSKLSGAVLSTVTPPSSVVMRRLAVDQDFLYASSTTAADVVLALSKTDLSTAWRFSLPGDLSVATDGAAAFVGSGSSNGVARVARGNRPGQWLRVTPATALGAPFRWLALPQR